MFQSFYNKTTSAGKIKQVFILPNGSLQFLIKNEFLHESLVNITSIEKVKQYARKENPSPFEIWAMKRFVKAMQSGQRCSQYMRKLISAYDEAHYIQHRGIGKRNFGQIDNHQRVCQNVKFRLSQLKERGVECKF